MNKLSLVAALALGGLVACSTLATAQDTNAVKEAKKGGRKGPPTIEMQMDKLTDRLTLTDEQKPKVKALLEDQQKKMQEVFTDTSLTGPQKREKRQTLNEEKEKKMKEILTADQFKKYQEMERERGGRKGPGHEKKGKKSE
jgi:Spy/CpxP family protein refolding chaperone